MVKRVRKKPKVEFEMGSGNVYADLGLPDAEAMLAKAADELLSALDGIKPKSHAFGHIQPSRGTEMS